MLRRLARWILRHEIRDYDVTLRLWKEWALAQQRYREEVHGEMPNHAGFRAWFFKNHPRSDGNA